MSDIYEYAYLTCEPRGKVSWWSPLQCLPLVFSWIRWKLEQFLLNLAGKTHVSQVWSASQSRQSITLKQKSISELHTADIWQLRTIKLDKKQQQPERKRILKGRFIRLTHEPFVYLDTWGNIHFISLRGLHFLQIWKEKLSSNEHNVDTIRSLRVHIPLCLWQKLNSDTCVDMTYNLKWHNAGILCHSVHLCPEKKKPSEWNRMNNFPCCSGLS